MTKKMAKIRQMNPKERKKRLKKLRRAIMEMETKRARGGLEETGEISRLKKNIAQILTVMSEEQE